MRLVTMSLLACALAGRPVERAWVDCDGAALRTTEQRKLAAYPELRRPVNLVGPR